MNVKTILTELDDVIEKLKMKITFLQTENKNLKKTIIELKSYVSTLDTK
jgi:chaperonin cofactor prefoldin|tara:strand:- start:1726 stop:1872 length:147 start_codon:yes stop_codon:yes gene_type:complete